jgi:SAM-dependent methyltransferase
MPNYGHNPKLIEHLQGLHSRGRLLDVGCADGSGFAKLQDAGFAELWGIEKDSFSATRAALHYDHVINTSVEDPALSLPSEYFDVVLCSDVLEHLYDPAMLLARLWPSLRQSGYLVVSTSNLSNVGNVRSIFLRGTFDYMGDFSHIRLLAYNDVHSLAMGLPLMVSHEWFDQAPGTSTMTRFTSFLLWMLAGRRLPYQQYLCRNVTLAWQRTRA